MAPAQVNSACAIAVTEEVKIAYEITPIEVVKIACEITPTEEVKLAYVQEGVKITSDPAAVEVMMASNLTSAEGIEMCSESTPGNNINVSSEIDNADGSDFGTDNNSECSVINPVNSKFPSFGFDPCINGSAPRTPFLSNMPIMGDSGMAQGLPPEMPYSSEGSLMIGPPFGYYYHNQQFGYTYMPTPTAYNMYPSGAPRPDTTFTMPFGFQSSSESSYSSMASLPSTSSPPPAHISSNPPETSNMFNPPPKLASSEASFSQPIIYSDTAMSTSKMYAPYSTAPPGFTTVPRVSPPDLGYPPPYYGYSYQNGYSGYDSSTSQSQSSTDYQYVDYQEPYPVKPPNDAGYYLYNLPGSSTSSSVNYNNYGPYAENYAGPHDYTTTSDPAAVQGSSSQKNFPRAEKCVLNPLAAEFVPRLGLTVQDVNRQHPVNEEYPMRMPPSGGATSAIHPEPGSYPRRIPEGAGQERFRKPEAASSNTGLIPPRPVESFGGYYCVPNASMLSYNQGGYNQYQSRRHKREIICGFCVSKGERDIYHRLKDSNGNVLCPVLSKIVCSKCGATGTKAHTYNYCTFDNMMGAVGPSRDNYDSWPPGYSGSPPPPYKP